MSQTAEYVRDVPPDEPFETTVNDAKAGTFTLFREYAVVRLRGGQRVLIRGGPYGIDLERTLLNDPFGRAPDCLLLKLGNESVIVEHLEFHVHPKPTGPSDDDLRVLAILNQANSLLFEIGGPPEGTIFARYDKGTAYAEQ